jgi:hypothetical protein
LKTLNASDRASHFDITSIQYRSIVATSPIAFISNNFTGTIPDLKLSDLIPACLFIIEWSDDQTLDSVSILHHLQSSNILHWINVGEIGLPFSCLEVVGEVLGNI